MKSLIHAIKYHNITPIAIAFVLLGATGAMASDDIRHAVIGERIEEIQGVDNKALLALDVGALDQEMRITDVSETDAAYRVSYAFETFDVREHDWGPVTKEGTLTVGKEALGGRDLGLYVQKELGEIVDAHADYLAVAKERAEESGRTTPTKTTSYTKLAGLVLNSQTKQLDGYEPEVEPPEARRQETEDTTKYTDTARITETQEQEEELQDEQNISDTNAPDSSHDAGDDTATSTDETAGSDDETENLSDDSSSFDSNLSEQRATSTPDTIDQNTPTDTGTSTDTATSTDQTTTGDNSGNDNNQDAQDENSSNSSNSSNSPSTADTTADSNAEKDADTTTSATDQRSNQRQTSGASETSGDESAETSSEVSAEETGTGEDSSDDTDTASSTPEE